MRRLERPARAGVELFALALLALSTFAPAAASAGGEKPLEIWLAPSPAGEAWDVLIKSLLADLERTPRRHRLVLLDSEAPAGEPAPEGVLAFFEIHLDRALETPRIELAAGAERSSPGWLVHAVVQAAETVGLEIDVVDARSSWIGQLVARSTRRRFAGPAHRALALGLPSLGLRLPAESIADGSRQLAALARRLDALDGHPVFEDQFLVAFGRVWLRRDLYWLGLALWLVLYWRGRRLPGRESRWLFLLAWLVTPLFGAVLLTLPALLATWRPAPRWLGWAALLPPAIYTLRLGAALLGGARLVVASLPALLVVAALAAFLWGYVRTAPVPATKTRGRDQAA